MLDTMIANVFYPPRPENTHVMRLPVKTEEYLDHVETSYVKAAAELELDFVTEVLDVHTLSQKCNKIHETIEIIGVKGRLLSVSNIQSTCCWLKMVSIAKDCQSSNVILMNKKEGIVLKTIKIIPRGEPLLMWFSETLLAMMQIPFLTPRNILAENMYSCNICNYSFEYPNPLKMHIALQCSKLEMSDLWSRISEEININQKAISPALLPPVTPFKFQLSGSPPPPPAQMFPLRISPTEMFPLRTSPVITEILNNSANINSPTSSRESRGSPESGIDRMTISPDFAHVKRNFENHHSAFKPYMGTINYPQVPSSKDVLIPHFPMQTPSPPINNGVDAAELETICSNLGKLKQGHRCIYCGKIYSRKYGLKIHIRTHTGYKPLQCKYCKRPFGDPSNLNKHVRLHSDAERKTPYKCNICGKILARRRDLDRHIQSRHQDGLHNITDTSSDDLDV